MKSYAKRNKKVFQSLIMKVQTNEGLDKLKSNPRITSYLQLEDYFRKLKKSNLDSKLYPILRLKMHLCARI